MKDPSACTIISRNYLSHARVLASSYLKHHRGARFYLLVVDKLPGSQNLPGVRIIDPTELDIPDLQTWYFKYDVTELCTAVKPACLKLILTRYGEESVIYLDPDILVTRRLEEVTACFDAESIVLTPHLLKPIPLDGKKPDEREMLIAGAYNLGFLGIQTSEESGQFLDWWQERLRDGCFANPSAGLMTDQKWIDLVPSLHPTRILKDETYNVAYWNLHSRTLGRQGDQFQVNGRPLAFFHFSGFNPAKPNLLSKFQNRIEVERGTPLADLLGIYVELQYRNGFGATAPRSYGYGMFDNGGSVSLPMRRLWAGLDVERRTRFGNPFRTGLGSFLEWATAPEKEGVLTPFLKSLYSLRPDVAARYPDVHGCDRKSFFEWAGSLGAAEMGYEPEAMRIFDLVEQRLSRGVRVAQVASVQDNSAPTVKCSILIPVFNNAVLTRNCLDTILKSPPAVSLEIIVSDDGSTDGTSEVVARYGGRVRSVTRTVNRGFATSCNEAAAAAKGEFLLFLNNDTLPKAGWLDALICYAETSQRVAIVGSKLLFPNETIQHAGIAICEDREPRHLYTGFPADHPAVNRSRRVQAVTGACLLIRRDEFHRVSGFDTTFHNGYEDVDLCLRVSQSGREVHYCCESVLYHLESVSRTPQSDHPANRDRFRKRWGDLLRPDEFQYYVSDELLRIDYRAQYPLRLSPSPLLAVVDGQGTKFRVDRLLDSRSRQVLGLLKDNIRLSLSIQQMELHSQNVQRNGKLSIPPRFYEPRVIARGQILWMSDSPDDRLVSLVMPVKNGAAKLRKLLPAILGQKTTAQVEIIAVDSASTDETVEVLRQANATVITIDPRSFNHGLTRNLASRFAAGNIFVFLNQSTLPADENWLENLLRPLARDKHLAAVCGRMLPHPGADFLTACDGFHDQNARTERVVSSISNWDGYRAMNPHQLREFANFHTLSAAIRADVFLRMPFREANFAEDLIWGKEALEAGLLIGYEPSSVAYHSHQYSLLDILRRNFDDGAACRRIVGRTMADEEVTPSIVHGVLAYWRYLETECQLSGTALEEWRINAAMRRTAQVLGQWMGAQSDLMDGDLANLLSITEQIKAGVKTEVVEWSNRNAYTAG